MSRTFEEKVKYNEKRSQKSEFAAGYDLAVTLYKSYIKSSKESRKVINNIFDGARKHLITAKAALKRAESDMAKENAQGFVDYNKGILCGMRDAANERKSRKTPFS